MRAITSPLERNLILCTITSKDGTQIYYKDWGRGPVITFSHGWPLNADAWDGQMHFLVQQGFRVVAHDRRGHGRSEQASYGNDMNGYADDLAAVIETLDLRGVTLVGHSTGGGEVTRYISRHGTKRVAKAVLISAVPPLMLNTAANPEGLALEVFDSMRAGLSKDRSQFYRDLATQFYGANRPGARVSQGILRTQAEILLSKPGADDSAAEALLAQALALARRQSALAWELRIAITFARLRSRHFQLAGGTLSGPARRGSEIAAARFTPIAIKCVRMNKAKVLGLVGWSGSGKTTLIIKLIPELKRRGLTVATLKHAHHNFDVDKPGKDSYEHRKAGASEVIVSSALRWAQMHEVGDGAEATLAELLQRLSPCDVVLVEGFKTDRHPKLEVFRKETQKTPLYPQDDRIVAVATDHSLPDITVPVVDLNNVEAVADLVCACAESLDSVLATLGGVTTI
jgi:molybdopterin-guanine dinucleotide biosynthesis protein MobB